MTCVCGLDAGVVSVLLSINMWRRNLRPSERFKAHAHHVQAYSDHYIDIPIAIYQALSFHFHDRPILPNLVEMNWTNEDEGIFPYISMFLGPRIRTMKLGLSEDTVQHSLLSTLGRRCPSLVHLELVTMDYYPNIGSQMKPLLSQWDQLETLIIHGLPEESLQVVAALPRLLSSASDYENTFSPAPGTDVFPALQDLSITDNSPVRSINLLKAATTCPLETFTLSLLGLDPPDLRNLFATLAELRGKGTLTIICIDVVDQDDGQPGTTDELRLLFPLTSLTHLVLITSYGFDIGDAFVHEMAAAWPHISTLNIGAAEIFQPFEPQRLTLQGLAPLAELCPNLQKLTVHVNAAHICSNHFDTHSGFNSQSCVEHLNVGHSPISQQSVPWAAAYLSAIFPKLRSVEHNDDYGCRGLERPPYLDRWSDVNNHLIAYRHVSGHRRNDFHCGDCGLHGTN
ncbi:hypothetical protein BD779DRAFT_1809187 [Infundibulicybe gibba]|nr:hypothetical protein BD779DRAFT_1809187 [Infundibulicybe gibba]